jgi:hypothetical protein
MGANKSKQNKQEFLGFFSCKDAKWALELALYEAEDASAAHRL